MLPHIDNRFHDNLDLTSYVDMQSEKCWVRIYVKIHRQTRMEVKICGEEVEIWRRVSLTTAHLFLLCSAKERWRSRRLREEKCFKPISPHTKITMSYIRIARR